MPHINHRRGETRAFVFRREGKNYRRSMRLHGRRSGKRTLWNDYRGHPLLGYAMFACHCCTADREDKPYRWVRRKLNHRARYLLSFA